MPKFRGDRIWSWRLTYLWRRGRRGFSRRRRRVTLPGARSAPLPRREDVGLDSIDLRRVWAGAQSALLRSLRAPFAACGIPLARHGLGQGGMYVGRSLGGSLWYATVCRPRPPRVATRSFVTVIPRVSCTQEARHPGTGSLIAKPPSPREAVRWLCEAPPPCSPCKKPFIGEGSAGAIDIILCSRNLPVYSSGFQVPTTSLCLAEALPPLSHAGGPCFDWGGLRIAPLPLDRALGCSLPFPALFGVRP